MYCSVVESFCLCFILDFRLAFDAELLEDS